MEPKQSHYPTSPRPEVADQLHPQLRSLLDIGCARGGFGAEVRRRRGAEVRIVGVDPSEHQLAEAASSGYDEVVSGYFPSALAGRVDKFDCVVLNDVLEHAIDPWSMLRSVHQFLTPHGQVVASIPSIQYLPELIRVMRGRWDYTDDGTLDRTHLRFFTRRTMVEMFEGAGFEVVRTVGLNSFFEGRWRFLKPVQRVFGDSRYLQYVVVARSI